jgi:hypothetical protein
MMKLDPLEVIREMELQFPKELTICVQAVQIRMLEEQLTDVDEPSSSPAPHHDLHDHEGLI